MANIETLIKKMIDIHVKDADVYVNNGSLWLIFTEEKKWVIELDNAGNLWYNYHFFYKIFKLISMNVVDNQHYITRWVEDALQNGVNNTVIIFSELSFLVEDALQNGVKNTTSYHSKNLYPVEDALQNGVKHTSEWESESKTQVEDALQNGVKGTRGYVNRGKKVEDTVQNGVKQTLSIKKYYSPWVEDALENGVKIKPALESNEGLMMGTPYVDKFFSKEDVEDTVQNGVKETRWMSDWEDNKVEDTIQNGVKETKNLQWMKTTLIEDTVQNGVKI